MNCTLCQNESAPFTQVVDRHHGQDNSYRYHHCSHCDLVFMDPCDRLVLEQEKARYLLHDSEMNADYCDFLRQLWEPLENKSISLEGGEQIQVLDYGCGPYRALESSQLAKNYKLVSFDPIYHAQNFVSDTQFDLIFCSEVAEHFYEPSKDFSKLAKLLKHGGTLGIMTLRRTDDIDFSNWFYRRDFTHVSFYSAKTLSWLADFWRWKLELLNDRVALFSSRK